MFKLHRNRTQEEGHSSRKGSRIRVGILGAGAALTVVGTLGAGAAHAGTPNGITDNTVYKGTLPGGKTAPMPDLYCPSDAPYVLAQQYNTNTSFRMDEGYEFTDWKWGFDVAIVPNTYFTKQIGDRNNPKYVALGLHGDIGQLNASATYWVPWGSTNWTLTLHCTSDINKAVVRGWG